MSNSYGSARMGAIAAASAELTNQPLPQVKVDIVSQAKDEPAGPSTGGVSSQGQVLPKAIRTPPAQLAAVRVKPNTTGAVTSVPSRDIPAGMRHEMIELAAYLRAEQRGFAGGSHFEDWLAAEAEVDAILSERYR